MATGEPRTMCGEQNIRGCPCRIKEKMSKVSCPFNEIHHVSPQGIIGIDLIDCSKILDPVPYFELKFPVNNLNLIEENNVIFIGK